MPKYQEFEAWIEIEGVRATEYSVDVTNDIQGVNRADKVLTCWIASQMNKVSFPVSNRTSGYLMIFQGRELC